MNVAELIEFLKTCPQDLPVCFKVFSEQLLLDPEEIVVKELCLPRPDGWVANKRPDQPAIRYLRFPGN